MKTLLCALSLTALGLAVAPRAADAQTVTIPRQRTWVSGVGDDVNADDAQGNCSRTAPCKTFSGALIATAPGGEINCLDPAGYGAVTITKSVTILCRHGLGGILAAGQNAVVVNMPSATDAAVLDGLDIEGATSGLDGVRFIGLGTLVVRNTVIRDMQNGVVMQSATAGTAALIEDTTISTTGDSGVKFNSGGTPSTFVQLNRVTLINNGTAGVKLKTGATLYISASVVRGSTLAIDSSAGGTTTSFANNALSPVPQLTVTPLR